MSELSDLHQKQAEAEKLKLEQLLGHPIGMRADKPKNTNTPAETIPIDTAPVAPEETTQPPATSWADETWHTPDAPTGGFADTVKSYWKNVSDFIGTMPGPGGIGPALQMSGDFEKALIQHEVNNGNPYRAMIGNMYFGVQRDVAKLFASFATPTNIALNTATGGGSTAAKALAFASNIYFAWRGSEAMLEGKQNVVTNTVNAVKGLAGFDAPPVNPDELQSQLMGASQAAISGAGVGTIVKDAIHNSVQNSLGLKGDLAAKVEAKVQGKLAVEAAAQQDIATTEASAQKQIATTKAATGSQIAATEAGAAGMTQSAKEISQGIQESLANDIPRRMGTVMADAAQVVQAEQARMENLWGDLSKEAKGKPVISVDDLRTQISNTLTDNGVLEKDIPPAVWKGIPNNPTSSVRAPTKAEELGSVHAQQLLKSGMSPADVRSALINQGWLQNQVDLMMAMTGAPPQTSMEFKDLTAVKNNLWNLKQKAANPTLEYGLSQAHQSVLKLQEDFAVKNNFGASNKGTGTNAVNGMYENAKQQYFTFKRNLGGGEMSDFLDASTGADQNMISNAKAFMGDSADIGFVKDLLKSSGVDVSPLEQAIEEAKSVPKGEAIRTKEIAADSAGFIKQISKGESLRTKEIAAASSDAVNQIGKDSNAAIVGIGKLNSIVEGQSDLGFEGMTTTQIRRDLIERAVSNTTAAGITKPFAYLQIMLGIAKLSLGNQFGLFNAASGGSRIAIERALADKSFQDWVIQESGVETPQIPVVRKAIAGSYPIIRELAKSSAFGRALNAAQENQNKAPRKPSLLTPSAPAAQSTPGQIRIAQ
jgi:hypothetical protein